ncbi:hypothetical protein WSM22_19140 [Cytophagales bacterium WSM2-2]|nr:hypothetical protein WSM22_19140 [Cytophagales bacterium WSM2-2]
MKIPLLPLLICLVFFAGISTISAQNLWQTNPKECKLLNDTLGTKLLLVTLKPGDSLAPHTHPAYMVYYIEGGELTEQFINGRTIHAKMTPGRHAQRPGLPAHWDKNAGNTTIKFLMVEFSDKK